MKIAINVRFLIRDKLEGIGVFTYETLKRIVTNHKEHEFIFLFDRNYDPEFIFSDNISPVVIPPPARHPLLWFIWFNFSLPWVLRKIKPDLFISMDGFLPLKNNIKTLNLIYDIAFEHYPDDIPWLVSWFYRKYFPQFAKKSDRIATISDYTKNDLSTNYQVDSSKIDVVYCGSSNIFVPLDKDEKTKILQDLTGGIDYFVYVGALHKRKNLSVLLKAYDRFRELSDLKFKLVIIGRKAWQTDEMEQTYNQMRYREDVIFTGRVPDDLLVKYLGAAYALCYVSYFEGFGLPLLEAMYCDVPVITSKRTSLPEVAGNAGILIDPFNIEEIAIAMKNIAGNQQLRSELIEKGKLQRQKFSWDITSELLWDSILKTTKTSSR
jgi:glycosyltransferase involved in cell wall biosynthesis